MTDFQFRSVIKMVIGMVSGCETVDEAVQKLKELINDRTQESGS